MKRSTRVLFTALAGLSVFALMRLIMYISYPEFNGLSIKELITAFIQGVRFDSSVLFIVLGPILLMLLIPVKLKYWDRLWLWCAYIVFCVSGFFLAVDVVYFGHVKRHLSNELFILGNEGGFAVQIVFEHITLIIIYISMVIISAVFWNKFAGIKTVKERFIPVKIFLLSICCFLLIRGTLSAKPINTIDAFAYGSNAQANLILNGIMTSYRYGASKNQTVQNYMPDEDAYQVLKLDINSEYPMRTSFLEGKKHNVVIIILESWSAYFLGSYGAEYNVTPNFDNLSKDGLLFINHFAMEKRSIDGIQAILTGIPRLNGMPSLGFGLEVKIKGNLGSMADGRGFDTIFMQTSKRRSFYIDSISKALGFNKYFGMEDYKPRLAYPNPKASVFGWDYEGMEKFYSELDKSGKNFLGVFFSGTTHTPFAQLPTEYMKYTSTATDEAGFLNTLYYSDAALGNFIDNAKKAGWFENTVFIITADHTLGKFEKVNFPYDYHIPLLIYAPGIVKPGIVEKVTTHLDLMATSVALLGITGEVSGLGRNVLDNSTASFAYIHMGDTSAVVTDEGYVHIAANNILSGKGKTENLKQKLLAYQQVVMQLLDENRW